MNWKVCVYNEDKLKYEWIIQDRTENEARREAEGDIRTIAKTEDIDDWTMTEIS